MNDVTTLTTGSPEATAPLGGEADLLEHRLADAQLAALTARVPGAVLDEHRRCVEVLLTAVTRAEWCAGGAPEDAPGCAHVPGCRGDGTSVSCYGAEMEAFDAWTRSADEVSRSVREHGHTLPGHVYPPAVLMRHLRAAYHVHADEKGSRTFGLFDCGCPLPASL